MAIHTIVDWGRLFIAYENHKVGDETLEHIQIKYKHES